MVIWDYIKATNYLLNIAWPKPITFFPASYNCQKFVCIAYILIVRLDISNSIYIRLIFTANTVIMCMLSQIVYSFLVFISLILHKFSKSFGLIPAIFKKNYKNTQKLNTLMALNKTKQLGNWIDCKMRQTTIYLKKKNLSGKVIIGFHDFVKQWKIVEKLFRY